MEGHGEAWRQALTRHACILSAYSGSLPFILFILHGIYMGHFHHVHLNSREYLEASLWVKVDALISDCVGAQAGLSNVGAGRGAED